MHTNAIKIPLFTVLALLCVASLKLKQATLRLF